MLWFDLWTTYDPDGFTEEQVQQVTNPETGEITTETVEVPVPYEEVIKLRPTVRIDVSQDNRWTKLAEQQAADQLLNNQQIGFSEWVELCAENGPIPKSKLLKIVEQREQMQAQAAQAGQPGMPGQPVPPQPNAAQVMAGAGNPEDNMETEPVA